MRWRTAVVAAGILGLVPAACGGDDGEEATVETAEERDRRGAGATGCLLDAGEVSEAAGVDVTPDSFTVGGTGAGRGSASLDASGVEASTEDLFSVGWEGCTFQADDGTEYMVGNLVDEDGNPDLSGFEQLVAWAETGPETLERPEVGDEAFFDGEDLVVRDADRTLVVSFGFGATTEPDAAAFAGIAEAAITAGTGDLPNTCDAALAAAPAGWGELGPPLLGGGGESFDGVTISHDSCSAGLPDGGQLEVKVSEAQLFDLLQSRAESDAGDQEVPEMVPGMGDAAVRMGGRLYVRVGDRAATTYVSTPEGEPGDPAVVDALGAAAAEAMA